MLDSGAMGPTRHSSVQFGIYEVDLEEGEIRKSGIRIKVQQQPFKVLQALLERPGELVTREQLHSRIWPGTSYGDFDQAVNVAVAKLRTALGDSAENPRFIETVPRRGYRFIAPVQAEASTRTGQPAIANVEAPPAPVSPVQPPRTGIGKGAWLTAIAILVIAVVGAVILFIRSGQPSYTFNRISFGKGAMRSARFGPDGHTIVYGAAWNGKPMQLFWAQAQSPESRPYSLADADILAVSPTGELAILMNRRAVVGWISHGTLATMPIAGGVPHELQENVQDADWDRDGKNLAIVHWAGTGCDVEFPVGKKIYGVTGGRWLGDVRVSPQGDELAFLEHPVEGDDAGFVEVIDLTGRKKYVSRFWLSVRGLAWDPAGDSVWVSASEGQEGRELPRAVYRLTVSGRVQRVVSESGDLTLHDVSRDRALLLSRDVERYEMVANVGGVVRDLSWLDFSRGDDLSSDGQSVLMTVEGEAAGTNYEVYLRNTDGSPPVKLGEGYGSAISPDGQWALAIAPFEQGADPAPQLVLLPAGKGTKRVLTQGQSAHYAGGWFPDGSRIVFIGSEPGHALRTWAQDLNGGASQPITPEGMVGTKVSPDGKLLAALDENGSAWICPVGGGKPELLKGVEKGEAPIGWSKSGQEVYVARSDSLPVKVYRVDRTSGRREIVGELAPADPVGVIPDISSVFVTPDGGTLLYSYFRLQSDLYLATAK
jgi:DNA-binding winged helix-turn-helix (wHTH) protein/DNA-binding beta-propeller fold protein YncE